MNTSIRVASILFWVTGLGFGLPCVWAIWNLLKGRGLPTLFGFTAYGGGPFERVGIQTTVGLLVAFMVVGLLEIVAGWLLWDGSRGGAILAMTLVPVGALFWWGFALPFPPIFALIRTALIIQSWNTLH